MLFGFFKRFFVRHFATSSEIQNFAPRLNFFQNAAKQREIARGIIRISIKSGESAQVRKFSTKFSEVVSAMGGYAF